MLTKAQIKYIKSVTQHKFRDEHKVYLAEGVKIVAEILQSPTNVELIVATADWFDNYPDLISLHPEATIVVVRHHQLEEVSCLATPNQVLLVAHHQTFEDVEPGIGKYLLLDNIQDPGNMGTMVRIADWFGISTIYCGDQCADVYQPKVIQSAMGGHLRVRVIKAELSNLIPKLQVPLYAAVLNGRSIYDLSPAKTGAILIGNESQGIQDTLLKMTAQHVTIPRLGGAESRNAGVSAGILCAYLFR